MSPLPIANIRPAAMVLLDSPNDGVCEFLGWVEAIIGEEAARSLLAPFCCDEDGETGVRPSGQATRVLLSPDGPVDDESTLWDTYDPPGPDARWFWQFNAQDVAPVPRADGRPAGQTCEPEGGA